MKINAKEVFTILLPEGIKAVIVYLCTIFISMVFVGQAFIRAMPSTPAFIIYGVAVLAGIGVGYFLNRRIKSIAGVVMMIIVALLSVGIADMLSHVP